MKKTIILLAILLLISLMVGATTRGMAAKYASAALKDAAGKEVGQANFTEDEKGIVHVEVHVKGLSPGLHATHIHENGSCSPTFAAAGAHYNPTGKHHGFKNPNGPHAGDLPDIEVNAAGDGYLSTTTDRVTLSPGPVSLFNGNGTALVIHAKPDDNMSDPAGNSGDRIACGVIKVG
jgi:Cu-Zn family superoxide dismutase